MKAKALEDERHAAEKTNNEQGQAVAAQEELVKRHAEELRSLEAKLTAKHQEELRALLEKAQQEKPATTAETNQNKEMVQKAVIAELQAKHAEEISAAVERGRMESAAKSKLKDSQLVRAQKRVKELEAQIIGTSGSAAAPSAPTAGPSSSTTTPIASNLAQAATPSTPASNPAPNASATTNSPLPRKPSVANPPPPTGPARGVGRGTVRGRGVQRALGGAVGLGRAAPTKPAETPPAGGMQIMGAAAKRPLDDTSSEDSLAKRLKQAEPTAKPPVQIRRPPAGAPPPS
jgi:nucleoprotein TPR